MVVLPDRRSAQPGLGVRQEHVLEVLVCQHGHLHPLAGAGLHPAQKAGTYWHKLAQAGTGSPGSASLYCRDTLVTICSAQGAPWSSYISDHHLKISSECANEF